MIIKNNYCLIDYFPMALLQGPKVLKQHKIEICPFGPEDKSNGFIRNILIV